MAYQLRRSVRRYVQSLAAGAASAALLPGALVAQEIENPAEQSDQLLEEVVVTGTLIRGVEAVGSQTIGIDRENILETGAVTTNELLGTVPQVSNFFNQRVDQDPRGADRNTLNRPNLRNLPGINDASGANTLLLVDGHRLTPMGTDWSSLDADVVPGRVIENVAIVTDGGSSLYGADAVGGVINFVTLKEYEGAEIDVGYDTGDDYDGWQASVLAGTTWDGGSGYVFLGTTDRENVTNNERDWGNIGFWEEQDNGKYKLTPGGTECLEPVGAITSWYWYAQGNLWTDNEAAPGAGTTPVGEPCDIDGETSLQPKQTRDNIYGGIVQDITDGITLDTKAYYMKRNTRISKYPVGDTIAAPTPTELGVVGTENGELYDQPQVGFSYGVNPGYTYRDQKVDIETWGISPELVVDLPRGWQLRNTLHYGFSSSEMLLPGSNRAKLLEYIEDGELDPANVAAADPAVVADITDWGLQTKTEQELFFIRAIADGDVFELPSGPLRAAIGVEYAEQDAKKRKGEAPINGLKGYNTANRDIKSAFGELSIPVFESLDLSVSVRYDDYSDFGDTSNPNYGFNWHATDWLLIYGKYGESFSAPTLLDSLGTADGRYEPNSAAIVADPNNELVPGRDDVFLLEGASGALLPQTADIWAVGFDLMPLEGLTFNVNYYEIDFHDMLGQVNPLLSSEVLLNPDKFIFNPSQPVLDDFAAQVDNSDQFTDIDAQDVGIIVDRRQANTDEAELKGYDFGIQYFHDTRFGSFGYGLTGNYQSKFDVTSGESTVNQLKYLPDLYASANLQWTMNNWRARVTVNYTDEYDADPLLAINQGKVDSFTNTLLFVGYDFDSSSGLTEGLSLRFNVDNVFDEDPPAYRRDQTINYSQQGYSIGRVFKMGLTKRF